MRSELRQRRVQKEQGALDPSNASLTSEIVPGGVHS